ncbi:MAG: prolipoprotein diacylglyceryl transferase [Flavobacteriales bacterium]|jgi:prolipoprotein diacylglyceryl transferase|nr:prolipoprotein diacylglyceryl transferase [Flavobacteriales bacterium]
MYPTLYHLVYDIFGIEIHFFNHFNMFGLLVAFAFLGANYFFTKEVLRKEKEGLIPNEEGKTTPKEHVSMLTLIAIIFGFIGAKLFAWLEDPVPLDVFFSDPFSGLTIYGGLITAFLAAVIYLRKYKMPLLHFMDAVAPGLMLSYGIGRLGCHISGDGDWGIVNNSPTPSWFPEWLWKYNYPNNVLNEGIAIPNCIYNDYCFQLAEPVYPTPLYEAFAALILFLILWNLRTKIKIAGQLFFVYLTLNGLERFFIEKIRVNAVYNLAGFSITQAEIIAVLFMLIGITGYFWLKKHHSTSSSS